MKSLFLATLLLLVACSQPTPPPAPTPSAEPIDCVTSSLAYMDDVDALMARWNDAIDIAASTPRAGLGDPVADLQAIRRDLTAMDLPSCVETVRQPLVTFMEHIIEGTLAFMAQRPDADISAEFDLAGEQRALYLAARSDLGWETVDDLLSSSLGEAVAPTTGPDLAVPTATAAPTLEPVEALRFEIDSLLGSSNRGLDERLTGFTYLPNNDGYQFEIRWALQEGASVVETLEAAQVEASEMLRLIAESGLPYDGGVELSGTFVLADQFGDTIEEEVILARFDHATIERIQWPNFQPTNIFNLADSLSMQSQFEQAADIIDKRNP